MKLNINYKASSVILKTVALILLIIFCAACAYTISEDRLNSDRSEYDPLDKDGLSQNENPKHQTGLFTYRQSQIRSPYRGYGGPAMRSKEICERRLEDYKLPQNPNGRTANFVFRAKHKRYASGGFVGPGARCFSVSNEKNSNRVYGFILAVYDGGTTIRFIDMNRTATGKIGQTVQIGLGNVSGSGSIRLSDIKLQLTITDPPPVLIYR